MIKTFFAYISLIFSALYVGFSLSIGDIFFVYWLIFFVGIYTFFQCIAWVVTRKFSPFKIIESTFRTARIVYTFVGFVLFVLVSFSAYQSILSPGQLSNIRISNGEREVEFLQMSHIATEEFYTQKKSQIQGLIDQDFHFLLEAVQPGSQESAEKFQEYMSHSFDENLYPAIANFLQIKNQEKDIYAIIPDEKAHYIDVSLDSVVASLDTKNAEKTEDPIDMHALIAQMQNSKNEYEKNINRLLILGMLNFTIKNQGELLRMLENEENTLMQVILDERNTPIIDYIKDHSDQKIAVIYGGLHFQGVFSELKKLDSNWKIASYTNHTPFVQGNFPKNLIQNLLSWQLFVYSILTFLLLYFTRNYVKQKWQKTKPKTDKIATKR